VREEPRCPELVWADDAAGPRSTAGARPALSLLPLVAGMTGGVAGVARAQMRVWAAKTRYVAYPSGRLKRARSLPPGRRLGVGSLPAGLRWRRVSMTEIPKGEHRKRRGMGP
jgi:hypothetical protein